MTKYIDPYIDEISKDLYQVEGINKIKELSRQLRTFFNFQADVINYRFQSNSRFTEYHANKEFFCRKKETETLTSEFITTLKISSSASQTLEEDIQSLLFKKSIELYKKLSKITEKLFFLLHYFSENSLQNHPKYFKFILTLAQHLCSVKKCLNVQLSKFFEELEINYRNLNEELEKLMEEIPKVKLIKPNKEFEERLIS
ncbi:MAG: hypothetical protein EU540_06855 [Promethearchaeota archaeon]|nr:MAG: hypothetical protein EU540_06855 [Candidatus Lokiarchaeota archaeon]